MIYGEAHPITMVELWFITIIYTIIVMVYIFGNWNRLPGSGKQLVGFVLHRLVGLALQELKGQVAESMASAISEFVGKAGARRSADHFLGLWSKQQRM